MKKVLLFAVAMFAIVACDSSKKESASSTEVKTEKAATEVYALEDLLKNAEKLNGKTVTVKGTINHTCKFSGRRAFIVGKDAGTTFRVEAKGDIGGFNRELVGSELAITGVVRENRLSKEYIDQYAEQLREKAVKEDGSAETCGAEMNNIEGMRKWMKDNGKDYYSTYFMDGMSFEIVE